MAGSSGLTTGNKFENFREKSYNWVLVQYLLSSVWGLMGQKRQLDSTETILRFHV